jgi:photosystem II stability/assembly factor-like uncharacterized protein
MEARDRRQVRYEQFVQKRGISARFWIGLMLAAILAAAGAAYALLAPHATPTKTPPALSTAGRPVAGETYQWRSVAIGAGGFITGMSFDATGDTFVVRTDVYGAYIWDVRADRWQQLVTAGTMPEADRVQAGLADGGYEAAVAPSLPGRVYLAISGRIFRSDDRGASFRLASAGNPFPLHWDANSGPYRSGGPYMAVDPANADLVLLGSPEHGLWRSADGGNSWQRVESVPLSKAVVGGQPPPGTRIWFEQPAGGKPTGRIFAGSAGNGVFVSTDHGAHFAPLHSVGDQPMNVRRGAFDRQGRFFAVDDIGQTVWFYGDGQWHNLDHEANLPVKSYVAVATNPRSDQVVVFDAGGEGFASIDGGKTWTSVAHSAAVGPKDPPWLRIADDAFFATADVHFDPRVPNRLWIAAGMGVFYADFPPGAAVAEWQSLSRGIEELVANDVVQTPGHAPIFAGWDFGTHVKPDLTQWSTTFGPNERALMTVPQLDWSPSDPDFIVSNASDARVGCCSEDGNAVMAGYSTDDGQRWTKFKSLPTPPGTRSDDPWRMSFGSIAVSATDTSNIVWQPAYNRQAYFTKDRGATWTLVSLPGAIGDNPGSFKDPWLQRKTVTADKVTGGTFYYVHSGDAPNQALAGLWRSTDGGATWLRVFVGEIAPASHMAAKLRAVPGHAGHLFFTSAFAYVGDIGLRRSTDGGSTWALVPAVTRVDDIAFGKAPTGAKYPSIYISGQVNGIYGVWRSVDNAANWQQLVDFPVGTLDQVTAVGADPDVFGRVYLGYKGSSWIWGEPAACRVQPIHGRVDHQCSSVK